MNQKEAVHERLKEYACVAPDQMMQKLQINAEGITQEEAIIRRQKYGNNAPSAKNKDTMFYCIRRAFVNPFSTILFFLGLISLVTDVFLSSDYQKNLTAVLIIFSMLILSGIVRLTQELHSKRVADELFQLVHTTVQVLRGGQWVELSSSELVVGDQIRLEAGDRVPADLRLTGATDLFVSQSVITGESAILEKFPEALPKEPQKLTDYSNILFGGTTVAGGTGTGIVLTVGQETVYGGLTPSVEARKQGFDRGANSIAWVLIRFMTVLVPVVFLASGLTKGDWLEAFLFALSVAVGITPELLPMVVNACLAKGSHSMGKKQTIVKNINAMQSFGSMDVLCVDKTGTLTQDTVLLEYYMDILGNESQKVLDYAYLASHYSTGVGNHLDEAICKAEKMQGKADYYRQLTEKYQKTDELPFDYNRRFSSVLLNTGEENIWIIKGSIEEVARQCSMIEYRGEKTAAGADILQNVHAVVDEMLEDGMKVIAVAYKTMSRAALVPEEEHDFILLGYLAFFDAPKKSAASAIQKLHSLHVNVKVLTGDQKQVARSICRRIGIPTESCLTGAQLDALSENELPIAVEKTNIFAELSPKQKAMLVETLQTNGHTVGFLGDGLNDLPAVIRADVGISVENATEAVRESANVILLKKDLNVLEEGVLEGREAFANMLKYIKITASSNFGNICAIVAASVLLPFFPMTSIQLLLLNLLYDILCLILPWDHVDADLLTKPLEWSGRTLGKFMTFFGPVSSLFDLLTFVFLYFVLCPGVCGGSFGSLSAEKQSLFISMFQTGWFLESMWTQVLILQLLRTKQLPLIQSRPGRMVTGVTILGIVLFTLLPVTPVGKMLGMTAMSPVYFLFLVADVIAYLLLVTLAKAFYIKKNQDLI